MNKTFLNFAAAFILTFSAFAMENIFSISTDSSKFYEDNGFSRGELTIIGHKKTPTDKSVQLRMELFKKVGSSVQLDRFISSLSEGSALPMQAKVYKSNNNWQRVGSSSQGEINVTVGDDKNLTGELFGNSFNATLMGL